MKFFSMILILGLVWGGVVLGGQDLHRLAAQQVLVLIGADELFTGSMQQMIDVQIQRRPHLSPFRADFEDFFGRYMSWPSLEPDVTKMLTQKFTEQELREIATFYRTPAGHKALEIPRLLKQGAELGARRAQGHKAELEQLLTKKVRTLKPEDIEGKPAPAPTPAPE